MDNAPQPKVVVPNFRTPRTIGILNIVFGAAILVTGLCTGVYMMFLPQVGKLMEAAQQQQLKRFEEQRQSELTALDEQIKAAESDEQKQQLEIQKKVVEARPKPPLPPGMDFKKLGLSDPRYIGFAWFDMVTALVLNVLMITSGVGLTKFKEGARRTALWLSGLKIVRLMMMTVYWLAVLAPMFARGAAGMLQDMMQSGQVPNKPGTGPSMQQFTQIYGVMYSAMYVGFAVVAIIYPAICLWALTRPGVRAACMHPGAEPKPAGMGLSAEI